MSQPFMNDSNAGASLKQRCQVHQAARRADAFTFFNLLTGDKLLDTVESLLPPHRERLFSPTETLAIFSAQAMSADRSCQKAVDEALEPLGLERKIVTTVDGFAAALALTRSTDLVAAVPERHTENLRQGLFAFPLPFSAPEVRVSMLWHPRMDGDEAHRWLRVCIRDVCGR
jgi:DNA-binding transcriptional LysR family regulator